MDQETQRKAENFAMMCPLKDIEDGDMLAFMAQLIQDHDHLREKLESEPDFGKKRDKLEAMRPHLRFRALPISVYIANTAAMQCGVQPIWSETKAIEESRIHMPVSQVHETRN